MESFTVAVPWGTLSVSPQGFNQGSDNVDGGDVFTKRGISSVASFTSGNGNFAHIPPRTRQPKVMNTRFNFGKFGPKEGQFNTPHGFCLGTDEDIIVADTKNHRIQVFAKSGVYKFEFGIPGKKDGQLWLPRKLAVMKKSGNIVVCDLGVAPSRMQIFTENGAFVSRIDIGYIKIVAGLAFDRYGQIVAVDSHEPTVFVIRATRLLVRQFYCRDYVMEPSDIKITKTNFLVCDYRGHCVVVFNQGGQFLHRIGCAGVTPFPSGIDISNAGDVLIGHSHGNRFRIVILSRHGCFISEFECPFVEVSRCCGLKLTSEGFIVTVAKWNNHVMVMNRLYFVSAGIRWNIYSQKGKPKGE